MENIKQTIRRLLKESEIPKHLLRRLDFKKIDEIFKEALTDASKKFAKNKDKWNFMDEYKFNKMVVSYMVDTFFSDEEYYNSELFTEMWDDLYNFFSEHYYDQIRDRYYAIEGESGVVCEDCGWFWYLSDGGDDPYVCHKCGNDNTPKKTNVYETIRRILREETTKNYYRAITEFKGDNIIFEPEGYYESFDDDGNPEFHTDDIIARSTTPEISASKTIGGALLGVWSMLNHYGSLTGNNKIYIYSINEKPNKDLSHVRVDDFEYIQEVRYKKPVEGNYIGYFIFDNNFNKNAENFYERFTGEPWDEYTEEQVEMLEDFHRLISTLNKNDLKK